MSDPISEADASPGTSGGAPSEDVTASVPPETAGTPGVGSGPAADLPAGAVPDPTGSDYAAEPATSRDPGAVPDEIDADLT